MWYGRLANLYWVKPMIKICKCELFAKKKWNKYSCVLVTNVNQPKTRPGQPTFESHHITSLPSGPSNTCPQIVQLANRTFWQVFWIPSFVFSSFMWRGLGDWWWKKVIFGQIANQKFYDMESCEACMDRAHCWSCS